MPTKNRYLQVGHSNFDLSFFFFGCGTSTTESEEQ